MAIATLLQGATSAETAYIVNDYPYGFRLRCKIRYWLETTSRGTRFCSQTTNPKKGDKWNAPKKSTYMNVGVMFVDENNHIQWNGVSPGSSEDQIARFAADYASVLTERDQKELQTMRVYARAASKITYEVHADGTPQSDTEVKDIQRRALSVAVRELKGEGKL